MVDHFVPLDDIIGDTSHLTCKQNELYFKKLCVKTWLYTNDNVQKDHIRPTVVAIHGGPSFPHGYILPLKLLADSGYSVIFYDQAGCGKSTYVPNPSREAPWLLTLDYYLEELSQVLASYNLQQYYIFGSSWGSMIAQEFAVTKPSGLLGLILDGALADSQLYITSQWRDRISTLPTYSQNLLRKLTDQRQFDTPAYRAITEVLGRHFSCRVVPRPDIWEECIRTMNASIYRAMQGESEFTVSGVLENWSILDRLHLVDAPTLVVMGQFDSMTEECSLAIVNNIRNAWPLVTIPRAGHCKLLDEPQLVVAEITKFLDAIEEARDK
jgi:L-proline amide hydrolase